MNTTAIFNLGEIDAELARLLKDVVEGEVRKDKEEFATAHAKLQKSTLLLEKINKVLNNGTQAEHTAPLFTQNTKREEKPATGYDISWGWMQKSFFILEKTGHVLTVNDILDAIRKYEPNIGSGMDENYRKVQARVSAGLKVNMDSKTPKVNRYRSPLGGEFLYGFTKWFNNDGTIKNEYQKK